MSIHTSHSHVDHKALDSMLHNTLHMHHSYIHSSQSNTQSSSLPYSPLAPAPTSPALEPDHGYGSTYESDCLDNAVRRALKENRRRGQAVLDLNMNGFLSSNTSSSSSDTTDGVETPLTSSATTSPITRSSSQHLLPPAIPPRPTFSNKSTSLFLSAPASPTSTVSPTSPLKVTFSSPHYHRHDPTTVTTTFSSFYDQLSPHSKLQFEQKEPFTQDQSQQAEEKYIFEANTELPPSPLRNGSQSQPSMSSFFEAGSQQHSRLEQDQHRPSIPTRIRTSMGAVSSGSSSHTKNSHVAQHHRSQSELNGHPVQQLLTSHQQQQPLGGGSRVDMIPIHVRYVPKDLWVQVDVPRDMPVHKARDLILAKCRLTSMPIQTLSMSSSEETLVSPISPISPISSGEITLPIDPDQTLAKGTLGYEMLSDKQDPYHYNNNNSDPVLSRNRRPSRMTIGDDDSINDQESIDDEEAEMRAEELMADDMFPQSPPSRSSSGNAGLTESMLLSLQNIPFVSSRLRQDSQSSFMTSASGSNTSDMQKQRGRSMAYSKLHRDDGYGSGSGSGGDSSSKDGSSIHSRLSNIPGWSHYRNRQNSNNGNKKCENREIQDHCSAMADFCTGNGDAAAKRETTQSECAAWKASFGLFWVAAGHWLDDSRLVSSYALQPHCLLELQLRNNYIQLPPPGSSLSYYDHYAEGVLYKMSKKSTGNVARNSSTGVWKERWVVLQGTSLLIYHKRRDMAKKAIELTVPLNAVSTVLPLSPRHSFRRASSCVSAMSTSMITLTISSDPNVAQLCFRATSESELNHWMRIFNSLNCKPLHNLPPPFDPTAVTSPIAPPIPVPPPLPPLPSVPPPSSVDGVTMSTTKRDRHHSYSAAYNRIPGSFAAGTGGWNDNEWNVTGGATGQYFSERKRSHTTQSASSMPSINPALLLNAAAAFSNLQSGNTSSSDESRGDGSSSCDDAGYHRSGSSCSSTGSISRPISLSLSLKDKKHPPHYRNSSPVSALLGSMLGEREPVSLSRSSSIGRTSLSMVRNSYHDQPEVQEIESTPRQRTSTEPGQRFRIRSMGSQRNSQQMFRDFIHRSKVGTPEALSDIASIPENQSIDAVDNALALEPGCQALLKSAMAGSSVAPLYSGYVWLYVPNNLSGEASNRSEIGSVMDGSVSSMPMMPSAMMKATNISMSKASGRYVKCFASINEKGQFQWVEVKKDDGEASEIQSQQDDSSSSQTMYGFQLKSSATSTLAQQDTTATNESNQANYSSVGERNADPKPTRQVQASMSRKLRLYFFCIKISPSSLAEVMIEMTETPPTALSGADTPMAKDSPMGSKQRSRCGTVPASTPSSPPPPLSRKSSRRIRHRFSAPVAPPASSYLPSASSSSMCSAPLPLLPSATMALHRSRSRSGAQLIRPNSFVKNSNSTVPTWPSMSGLHGRSQPASRSSSPPPPPPPQQQQQPTPPVPEKVIPKMSSMVPPPIPPRPVLVPPIRGGHHSKSRSLFAENWTKTRSAPPGSLFPSSAFKDSSATAKPQDTISCVAGRVVVVPAVPKTEKSLGADSLVMRSEPLSMISSMTTSGASSSVVSLAQDLKKAMRRVSISGAEDDAATASGSSGTPLSSHKPSLSEITAKKRASLQNQQQPQPYHQYQHAESRARARASLERERSRLKLVGGLTALEEACETEGSQEDDDEFKASSAQQKQRRRQRTTSGSAASVAAMLRMLMQCPFLEQSESQDADGRMYVTLKGYTETEEGWRVLQSALERFIDGPVKDNKAALPPVDTLIPSYHAPRRPDARQADKSPSAHDKNAAATAAAKALLGYEVLHGSSSPSSGYTTPPSTAAGPTGGASLSRSSSITRSSTPVGFNRHSVQMTTGTGYGPSRSFSDLGQTNNSNSSVNSLVSSPMALPTTSHSGYFSESHHHAISFSSQPVSAGRSAYDTLNSSHQHHHLGNNSSPASGIRAGWSSYGSSPVSTPGTVQGRGGSS
ncbi:hypothetical protein KVV02_000106 [Mortierella alpina]|uniref:PH domain-containing protein n=1 Tax=Mortierella alpina TaxID=64518 RepID=A0A9P8CVZ4_MORAP|nr:hypothetical protein KVV02_000106 [Mortierella alpina]